MFIPAPSVNTNCLKYSFFPRVIIEWNSLPNTAVQTISIEAFAESIDDILVHTLRACFAFYVPSIVCRRYYITAIIAFHWTVDNSIYFFRGTALGCIICAYSSLVLNPCL